MKDDFKILGTPTTIGELKKLIEKYDDDVPFGFWNQPIQNLVESDGGMVSFQQRPEDLHLDVLTMAIDTSKVGFPKCFSSKAIKIESLSSDVKEYFIMNESIQSFHDKCQQRLKEKLIRIILLCSDIYKEIEENEIPF